MANLLEIQSYLKSERIESTLEGSVVFVDQGSFLKAAALLAADAGLKLDILDFLFALEWKEQFRVQALLRSSVFSHECVLGIGMSRLGIERRYRVPSVAAIYPNVLPYEQKIEEAFGVDFVPKSLGVSSFENVSHAYYLRKDFSQGREIL